MADMNLTVDVDTSKAVSNLDKLTQSIDKVHQKFSGLGPKILGLGFATMTGKVIAMSDELSDLSNASGIAIGKLVEFKKALATAGGEAAMMPTAINAFVRSLDEAVAGGGKAQDAFRQLGIDLNDLSKLSEQDLLQKTLEGLGNIDDAGRRATIMMNLFGKSFKTVDPGDLAEKLKATAGSADKYAQSIKRAAELNDQMVVAQGALKMAFLEAYAPIIDKVVAFNKAMEDGKESVSTLVTIIQTLTVVMAAAFAFTGWGLIVRAIGTIGRGVGSLISMFGGAGRAISATFGANSSVMKVLRGVGGLIAAIGAGLGTIIGMTPSDTGAKEDKTSEAAAAADEKAKAEAARQREVSDALEKKRLEIGRVITEFKKMNGEVIDNINTENEMIGKSKEYQDILKAQEALYKRNTDEIDKLKLAKQNLTDEEKRGGMGAVIDAQILKLQEVTKIEADRVARAVSNANKLQQLEQLRLFGIQTRIDMEKQLQTVQDDIAKMTMTEIEKKYYDIEAAAKASGKAAIEAEEARRGARLSPEEAAQYYKVAMDGTEKLKEQTKGLYDQSRTFSNGWKTAFNEYADNASNAANRARDIFNSMTNNMNSALDNFVETGKLSFGDLANSIIKDIIKIELKSSAASLLTASKGMNWGSMLGFADGGTPPVGRASIVGENGPELFVPKSSGTIIPNNQLGGGGGVVNNHYYTVNAVDAKSVAQLFAENRKTLLGSVKMAEKETSYRMR
jgi:lambda family phage tail tape measure protein